MINIIILYIYYIYIIIINIITFNLLSSSGVSALKDPFESSE